MYNLSVDIDGYIKEMLRVDEKSVDYERGSLAGRRLFWCGVRKQINASSTILKNWIQRKKCSLSNAVYK